MGFHGKQIQPGTIDLDRLYTTGYIPSAASDLTTVEYVQALNSGLFPKAEARVRAIGNINLATPPSVIDGINMNDGDRVVLPEQTDPTENGIYDWHIGGMVRSGDADDPGDLKIGTFIYIEEGVQWEGFGYFISGTASTPPNIDIGVDPVTFSVLQKQNPYSADNGITLTGNVFSLGGPLSSDTLIDGGGTYGIEFGNLTEFEVETAASRLLFDKGGSLLRVENNAGTQVFLDIKNDWRFNLAMNDGGGAGQVNASYSVNLAPNGVVNDTNIVNAATNAAFAIGSKYSFAAGRNHAVGSTGTHGDSSTSLGIDTINDGEAGITSGVGSQLLYVANQRGGIVHGLSTGTGLKPVGVPYVTAVAGAVNISRNTAAQTSGNGALAQDSVILGGYDHHIPASSPGSVILGGSGIVARTSDPNQVYIPALNIMLSLGTGTIDDLILVRDSATGQIRSIEQSSIAGSVGDGNGTLGNSGAADLGGALTMDTVIDGFANYNFQLGIPTTAAQTLGDFSVHANSTITHTVYDFGVGQSFFSLSTTGAQMVYVTDTLSVDNRISVGNTGIQISGSTGFAGAVYDADYSANYTNRSLVDKEYVDNAIIGGSFTLTDGNGTTANGTAVDLGGILATDTDIDGDGVTPVIFNIGQNAPVQGFYVTSGDISVTNYGNLGIRNDRTLLDHYDGGVNTSRVFMDSTGMHLYGGDKDTNAQFTQIDLGSVDGAQTFLITDNRTGVNQSGIEYAANYSANYTNRSLVDKQYVDDAIAAGGDFWPLSGTATLLGNTTIDGDASNYLVNIVNLAGFTASASDGAAGSQIVLSSGVGGPGVFQASDSGANTNSSVTVNTDGNITISSQYNIAFSPSTINLGGGQISMQGADYYVMSNNSSSAGVNYDTNFSINQASGNGLQMNMSSVEPLADNLNQILTANWSLGNGFQMYRQRYSDIQPDSLFAMFQMNIDDAFIGIYDQGVTGSGGYIGISNSTPNSDYTPFASVNDNVNNGVMTAFRLKRSATGTGTTNPNAVGVGGRLDYELLIGPVQQVVSGAIDNIATAVGAGWETKFAIHVGVGGALTPVMEIDKYGARHAADYSANYTNRSLVDKEYVDNALAGGDFWSLTGTSILLSTVTIDGDTAYNVNFVDLAGFTAEGLGGPMYIRSVDSGLTTDGTVGVTGTSASITVNTTSGLMQFGVSYGGGLFVTDVPYARGVQYTADYSANYTNRSLVDKEYVDNAVAGGVTASNGLTETAGDIKLGGALTQNTTVGDNSNFQLSFISGVVTAGGANDGAFRFINDTGIDSAGRELLSLSKKWTGAGAPDNNNAAFIGFYLPNDALAEKRAITIGWTMAPTAGAEDGIFLMTGLRNGSNVSFSRVSEGYTVLGTNATTGGGYEGVVIGTDAAIGQSEMISIGRSAGATSGTFAPYTISLGYNANQGTHNIGADSIAIGRSTKTTGANSISIGTSNNVETSDSIAIGRIAFINNTGAGSIAIGASSISHGGAVALGQNSQALSTGTSTAIGAGAKANNSTAVGYLAGNTTGTIGQETISLGAQANSGTHNTGTRSIAIGFDNQSIGGYSIAIGGQSLRATATGSIIFGYGNTTLTNSVAESFGLGWGASTLPDILFAKTAASYINSQGGLVLGGDTITAANTILDIQSTTKGVAFPRMTTTERDAILLPYDGLMIYNTTTSTVDYHDGSVWSALGSGSGSIPAPQEDDRDMVPAVTSGDDEPTGLTITNTPTGLIIIALNGEIKSLGNGVKTKHCYFSGDGGTTARAFSAIVAGDELYWNGVIAGYDLDASDVIDFYYI